MLTRLQTKNNLTPKESSRGHKKKQLHPDHILREAHRSHKQSKPQDMIEHGAALLNGGGKNC